MTNHLVVQGVACLHTVNHLALFVITHARHHCYCLMHIGVEISIGSVCCSLNAMQEPNSIVIKEADITRYWTNVPFKISVP